MKSAIVHHRGGTLFVTTYSRTTDGLWISDGPCKALEESAGLDEVGKTLLDALSRSRSGIPHPTSWKHINDPLLEAAGVKSWNSFARNAKCVGVELSERLTFKPTRNGGAREGFVDIVDRERSMAEWNVLTDVGRELVAALASCE